MSNFVNHAWSTITNTFKKSVSIAGKAALGVEHIFVEYEPFAATAFTLAGQPFVAGILNSVYKVVEQTEASIADAPGADKLAQVQTIMQTAALPLLKIGLTQAGKTINDDAANLAITDAINAVVAENNAQAQLQFLLKDATASGKAPSASDLTAAYKAVSDATTSVLKAGTDIHAAIGTIAPAANFPAIQAGANITIK